MRYNTPAALISYDLGFLASIFTSNSTLEFLTSIASAYPNLFKRIGTPYSSSSGFNDILCLL